MILSSSGTIIISRTVLAKTSEYAIACCGLLIPAILSMETWSSRMVSLSKSYVTFFGCGLMFDV